MEKDNSEILQLKSRAIRIRRHILRMIKAGGTGHIGGALSAADIMSVLYFHAMKVNVSDPGWEDRDRFILSAGHKALVLYATLVEKGFLEEDVMETYGSLGSKLPGHPSMHNVPGIEASTGALGHGLSIAGGMALGLKMSGRSSRVFAVMGDGELAEGSNWEAAAAAAHHGLDNLMVFVDCNGLQISGETRKVMNYEPLAQRWSAFGWSTREIDGHDHGQIMSCTDDMPFEKGKPSLVIARTVKAKGFSFAEGRHEYHHWKATSEEIEQAERELDEAERSIRA